MNFVVKIRMLKSENVRIPCELKEGKKELF